MRISANGVDLALSTQSYHGSGSDTGGSINVARHSAWTASPQLGGPHQKEDQQKMVEVGARSAQCIGDDAHALVEGQHLGGGVGERAREQASRDVRREAKVLRLDRRKKKNRQTSTGAVSLWKYIPATTNRQP